MVSIALVTPAAITFEEFFRCYIAAIGTLLAAQYLLALLAGQIVLRWWYLILDFSRSLL